MATVNIGGRQVNVRWSPRDADNYKGGVLFGQTPEGSWAPLLARQRNPLTEASGQDGHMTQQDNWGVTERQRNPLTKVNWGHGGAYQDSWDFSFDKPSTQGFTWRDPSTDFYTGTETPGGWFDAQGNVGNPYEGWGLAYGSTFGDNPESSFDSVWGDVGPLVTSIAGGIYGAGGFFGPAEAAASGGATAAGESAAAAAGTGEPGMWDWLDGLLGETGELGVDPGMLESGFNSSGGFGGFPGIDSDWLNEVDPLRSNMPSMWDNMGDSSWLNAVDPAPGTGLPGSSQFAPGLGINSNLDRIINGARRLFGGDGGNASGGGTRGGSILDSILGDPLGAAFNATPFLLALNEANRQGDDLNGVLGKINGEAYTKSVLNPYDMDTGIGRSNMMQDQNLRGVRGSSFGQNDLSNYNYMRSLGRGDLANRANLASAQLEGNLINTRNTNRNLLLGAGLSASGRLFEPQRDPFGLQALFR